MDNINKPCNNSEFWTFYNMPLHILKKNFLILIFIIDFIFTGHQSLITKYRKVTDKVIGACFGKECKHCCEMPYDWRSIVENDP